jgi:hypothetical protein
MKSCISLAKEIVKKGHTVKFFGYGYSDEIELLLRIHQLEIVFWKPYNELKDEERLKTNFFIHSKCTLQKKLKENNIEFVHLQDYESTKDGLWAALRLSLPYVITIPGGPVEYSKLLIKNMPVVLYSKEQIQWYESRSKLFRPYIYHLIARIDNSYFENHPTSTKYNNKRQLSFLLPIRLDSDKRGIILSAIRLIVKISDKIEVVLNIMGEGDLRDELISLIDINQWHDLIKLKKPAYNDSDLQQEYEKTDFVIGNGRAIMESLSMMIPVICMGESGEFLLVTSENIGMISDFNFSGRHFRSQIFNYEKEFNNLIIQIQDLDTLVKINYNYANQNLRADRGAKQLLDIYLYLTKNFRKFRMTFLNFSMWFLTKKIHYYFVE